MDKLAAERICLIVLMPGVTNVNIHTDINQVWISVEGHKETRAVVNALANMFSSNAHDHSYLENFRRRNQLSYTIYPSGLIFSIDGKAKEKLSAPTESDKENIHLDSTIDLARVESLLEPWENEVSFESLRKEVNKA